MVLRSSFRISLEVIAIQQLRQCFEEEHCYLQSDFSLEGLHLKLGLSKERLITLLHSCYGQSFNEVCSRYRIKRLKELILKHGNEISIAEYADLSGFKEVSQMQLVLKDYFEMSFDEFSKYVKGLCN
jgi:AraC-like DNA-binding protein